MKKASKLFAVICAAVALVLALCACAKTDVYQNLNNLVAKQRNNATLTVTTSVGTETLVSVYTLSETSQGTKVDYSIQTLSLVDLQNPDTQQPRVQISTGSYVVNNGNIISQNGENCDVALATVSAAGLRFEESFFDEVTAEEGSFSAKVTDASGFIGATNAENMTVKVTYSLEYVSQIVVSYNTSDASVTIRYDFN
ncbi:MAG: hypothetical protein ACI4QH_05265 [Candidatus Fimimonas sp.]